MRIVLTRLDRVGDLVLSTPAIASVRRSWPQAHVTMVCNAYNAPVVENNPDLDELLMLPGHTSPATFGRTFRGKCDIAIALAPRFPDYRLVAATGAPKRVGYTYVRRYVARLSAALFLTDLAVSEADPELAERSPHPVRHEVDQVLSLVTLAGGSESYRELVVPISAADRAAVASVPADAIAFHLGLRWLRDGSTLESAIALIRMLREFGLPIVVTHGGDTLEAAAHIRAAGVADEVIGGLPFLQWAAVFEKSRLVVTVDTAATHVASATRRPAVVLFEHRYFHLSSQEWSPYHVPSVCLRKPAGESPDELAASRESTVAAVASLLRNAAGS